MGILIKGTTSGYRCDLHNYYITAVRFVTLYACMHLSAMCRRPQPTCVITITCEPDIMGVMGNAVCFLFTG